MQGGASAKGDAQRRADRIQAFHEELAELEREGVLSLAAEQRRRLDQHHYALLKSLAARFDVDTAQSEKRISWAMRLASTIAGGALCAAAVLFFYRVWGFLSLPAQTCVLVAAPLICLAAMEFAARRERTPYYTSLLGIAAFAAAVLNVNALGGIFNLAGSPYAFLVWSLFGLGLAYAYGLRLPLAAGLVCGIAFVATQLASLSGAYWNAVDTRAETVLAGGVLALAAPALIRRSRHEGFPLVYRLVGLFTIYLTLLVLSLNGRASWLPIPERTAETGYQALGFAAAALAMRWGVARDMPAVVNLSAGAFAVYLFVRLFEWWWDWIPRYLFFLIVGLLALGLLYVFHRMRAVRKSS